jgi:hypothetical protein
MKVAEKCATRVIADYNRSEQFDDLWQKSVADLELLGACASVDPTVLLVSA